MRINPEALERLLGELGIVVLGESSGNLRAACPVHLEEVGHHDSHPSWYISVETGAWLCFSCQARGSLHNLVVRVTGLSDWEATEKILEVASDLSDLEGLAVTSKVRQPQERESSPSLRLEALFSLFLEPPDWALSWRQLEREWVRHYQIGWDPTSSSWIIPIRDSLGTLKGWQIKSGRSHQFSNYPVGVKKRYSLFGAIEARAAGASQLMVVESPLDVVYLAPYLQSYSRKEKVLGAVSTYGAACSAEQFTLIKDLAEVVVWAFDHDAAGERITDQVVRQYGGEIRSYIWPYPHKRKDPGEMTSGEIRRSIHRKKYALSV